jgi:hypothetical protein
MCPEAWYLERHRVARNHVAKARLTAGAQAHRRIGQRTGDLQVVAQIRLVLLAVIVLLIAWLALQVLGASGSLT